MSVDKQMKRLEAVSGDLDNGDEMLEFELGRLADRLEKQRAIYKKTHGGLPPTQARTVELHNPTGEVTVMGELLEVGYLADKNEGKEFLYVHEFEQPLPVLVFDRKKRLYIAGGGYTVTSRGIEG